MADAGKTRRTLVIPDQEWAAITDIAERIERPRSWVITRMIRKAAGEFEDLRKRGLMTAGRQMGPEHEAAIMDRHGLR